MATPHPPPVIGAPPPPQPPPPPVRIAPTHPAAASALRMLVPVLDSFNHRHHNQHRLAHWWPVFRIMRRSVHNLIQDLNLSTTPAAVATAIRSMVISRVPPRIATRPAAPTPQRAIWLYRYFIPKSYIAFSQLAADNQHAPLGLLLMAILARLHSIVSLLLMLDRQPTNNLETVRSAIASANSSADAAATAALNASVPHAPRDPTNSDRGVAVSRRAVFPATVIAPNRVQTIAHRPLVGQNVTEPQVKTEATQTSSEPQVKTEPKRSPEEQKVKIGVKRPLADDDDDEEDNVKDQITSSETKSSKTKTKTKTKSPASKEKKKKRKAMDDELSSLFGSLA